MSIGINQQKEPELQGPLSTIIGTSFLILLRQFCIKKQNMLTKRKSLFFELLFML